MIASLLLAFTLGGVAWTFTEYTLHRWGAHEGPNRLEFRGEHLAHHARANYFAPTRKKVWAAVRVVTPMAAAGWFLLGPVGVAFALGFGAVYGGYEVLHRRIHTHPPRGPYSRLLRKHHFAHHFVNARANHGVTSPVWDVVFRTRLPEETVVRVPVKLAPLWLLDDDGEVRAPYVADYERRGRPARRGAGTGEEVRAPAV
jgi:4-hydroxysphinganine ceramide fatty acyl 2-hydroxylase